MAKLAWPPLEPLNVAVMLLQQIVLTPPSGMNIINERPCTFGTYNEAHTLNVSGWKCLPSGLDTSWLR